MRRAQAQADYLEQLQTNLEVEHGTASLNRAKRMTRETAFDLETSIGMVRSACQLRALDRRTGPDVVRLFFLERWGA